MQHRQWPIQRVFDLIDQRSGARMLVQKSPSTVLDETRLGRLHQLSPKAYYLHLARHPRATCKSIYEIQQKTAILTKRRTGTPTNPESLWLDRLNRNILRFTSQLRSGQTLCIQGNSCCRNRRCICRKSPNGWKFAPTRRRRAEMLHPERSPYARIGPPNAPFGHDPNFLHNPRFEKRPLRAARLEEPFDWPAPGGNHFSRATLKTARILGYR